MVVLTFVTTHTGFTISASFADDFCISGRFYSYIVRMQKAAELDVRMGWKKQGLDYDQLTMVCKDKGMPWLWDMVSDIDPMLFQELLNMEICVRYTQIFIFLLLQYFIKGQDGCMPFITDWTSHDSMHASAKIPVVGTLTSVKVSAPGDHIVHKILESPTGMDLSTGSASLEFTFSSPKGSHTLSSSDPIGISFPGRSWSIFKVENNGIPFAKL